MRKAGLALLIGLSPALAADDLPALTALLQGLDAVAQQRYRLDAEVLRNRLGLSIDSECVVDKSSPGSCWRDVSVPGQGWRGAAGDSPATVSALTLDRLPGPQPCATTQQLGAVFKQVSQPRPRIAGIAHAVVDGMEATHPVFKPMPAWRYPGKGPGYYSEIWMAEDELGCVKQIVLVLDMPESRP